MSDKVHNLSNWEKPHLSTAPPPRISNGNSIYIVKHVPICCRRLSELSVTTVCMQYPVIVSRFQSIALNM